MGGGVALELGRRGVALSVTAFSPIGMYRAPGIAWGRSAIRGLRVLARVLLPVLPALFGVRALKVLLVGLLYGRPADLDPGRALADSVGIARASGFQPALARLGWWRPAMWPGLQAIPVTIAWGTRDRLLTYRTQSARARRLLPSARHVGLPGCGHIPFPDDPAACLAAVLSTTAVREAGAIS